MDDAAAHLSERDSQILIDETFELLDGLKISTAQNQRLSFLLSNYFQEGPRAMEFRSLCCFGHRGGSPSLQDFNQLCILPRTNWRTFLDSTFTGGPIFASAVDHATRSAHMSDLFATARDNITLIFHDVVQFHPRSDYIKLHIPGRKGIPSSWSLSILGLSRRENPFVLPEPQELRNRILLCIDAAIETKESSSPSFRLFSLETGLLWKPDNKSFDASKLYLEECAKFPAFLEAFLAEKKMTLDKLAKVSVARRYPGVEALVKDGFARAKKHGMESHNLFMDNDKSKLGGTVFAFHNCHYSPEWIANYLVETDNNCFMADKRAQTLSDKERLLRIFSAIHQFDDPSWIQFGEHKNVYLYLSQAASTAEQGWLTIASFVINLLIENINTRLRRETGGKYLLSSVQYDVGVANIANPSVGSLGGHQDGKPGIVCPHTPGFSDFHLMVPTFAVQNHCAETTNVSWWLQSDKSKSKLATISHDFFINHWQLMGVNSFFMHEVSDKISSEYQYFFPTVISPWYPSFVPTIGNIDYERSLECF